MRISFPIEKITIHSELEHKKVHSWSQRKVAKLFKLKLDGPYYEYQFKIHFPGEVDINIQSVIGVETFGVPMRVITTTKSHVIAITNHVMRFETARLVMMAKNGLILYQALGEDKTFVRTKY